jgi:hypothetical protein
MQFYFIIISEAVAKRDFQYYLKPARPPRRRPPNKLRMQLPAKPVVNPKPKASTK